MRLLSVKANPLPIGNHLIVPSLDLRMNLDRRFRWLPALAVAVVVLAGSVAPVAPGETTFGPFGLVGTDKYTHAFAYLCLGGTLAFALAASREWVLTIVLAVVVASLYGGGIEVVQGFVGRDPSIFDWAADILGALIGALLAAGLDPWLARFRSTV